jgi:hypothetical protein
MTVKSYFYLSSSQETCQSEICEADKKVLNILKRKLMMKFEDKFSLPLEWISDETKRIVESCREIVEKEIIPVRHENY